MQEEGRIDRHNRAYLRRMYPGYDIGRLPLFLYDELVDTTRQLIKAANPDPIGDWFDRNGFKEA